MQRVRFSLRSVPYALILGVFALSLLISPNRSGAQGPLSQTADGSSEIAVRALFEQGTIALDRGQYRKALGLYEEAYSESHLARMLYNIGLAAERDHQPGRALASYVAYLRSAPDVEKRENVQKQVDRLSVEVKKPGPTVRPPTEHRELMEQARRARSNGEHELAWRLYKRADDLFPTARTLTRKSLSTS